MHPALEAFRASPPGNHQAAFNLMQCIDQLSPEDSTCALLDIIDTLSTVEASNETSILSICVYKLLRRRITLDDSAVERLTLAATARNHNYPYLQIFIAAAGTQVTPSLREALLRLRSILEDWLPHVFAVELLQRLDALILTKSATSRFGILPGAPGLQPFSNRPCLAKLGKNSSITQQPLPKTHLPENGKPRRCRFCENWILLNSARKPQLGLPSAPLRNSP